MNHLQVNALMDAYGYGCTVYEDGQAVLVLTLVGWDCERGAMIVARKMNLPVKLGPMGPERLEMLRDAAYGENVEVLS